MSFGKFHESEGLAAIARAMRQKKEQQAGEGGGDQEAERNGSKLSAPSVASEEAADAKEKKKEKKSKKRKGEAAEVEEEQSDERKNKDKKSKKRSEDSEDDHETKSNKKAKKDKERKKEKAVVSSEADGEDIVADTPKKKKKKKDKEEPEKLEDGGDEDGPILRLVKAIHSAEALQENLKNASELSNPSTPANTQDQLLAATSSTGARAVSLLLKTLQKSSEMRHRPSSQRAKGQVGGARHRNGNSSTAFETPEEALHTDLASAGNAGLHAQKLWSSILQCNGESTAAARAALRGSAAAQDAAASAGGDQRGPSGLDQQQCNTFGDFYRSSFVDAYAEDLEAMRQAASNERPVKAEVLLKCIQAGTDLFTEDVQKLMMANAGALPSSAANNDAGGAAGTMSAAGHMTVHDILYGRI